jgi:adenylate kinase
VAQTYWSKEVAKILGIGESTLRKYCLALESAGYRFDRGVNNSRVFYSRDVLMLERLVAAINDKTVTLEQAVKLAIASEETSDVATAVTDKKATIEQPDNVLERLERLEAVNKELIHRLDQQQKLLLERDARRQEREEKRDAQLMQLIRETQETKRLIAAAEQKKSWWQRLFTK